MIMLNLWAVALLLMLGCLGLNLPRMLLKGKILFDGIWLSIMFMVAVIIAFHLIRPSVLTLSGYNLLLLICDAIGLVICDKIYHVVSSDKITQTERQMALRVWYRYIFETVLSVNVVIVIVCGFWTSYNLESSYHSLNVELMSQKTAPTLYRNQTPIAVAPDSVFNKVTKAMSEVPNASGYQIALNHNGQMQIQAQYYHGQPVYIVPLAFRDFFNYHNLKTIPGYFMISATDANAEPLFVRKKIKFSDSNYYRHNVNVDIYNASLKDGALSQNAKLVINDHQVPYYIKTLYSLNGIDSSPRFNQLKIAVENAQTGKLKIYRLKDTPKFISTPITSDVAEKMVEYYGLYSHGFVNAQFFAQQQDVKKATQSGPEDGVTSVFDRHGQIRYLADYTSLVKGDKSALGYMMINARTGKMKYYQTTGIMDTIGAIDNANKTYHAQNFHASMPVLYSINNQPTWLMNILDTSGLQRGFYYVNASNPSLNAGGTLANQALSNYQKVLVNSTQKVSTNHNLHFKKVAGTIERANTATKGSAMFTLVDKSVIYTVDTTRYPQASLLQSGDTVSFKVAMSGTNQYVVDFKDTNVIK